MTDFVTENLEAISELTNSGTDMLLSMAHMTNADMVTFDSEMLVYTASSTISTVRDTVKTVISNVYPFLTWLHKLFCVLTIIVLIIIIVIISFKIWSCVQDNKNKTNISKFIKTLDSTSASAENIQMTRL
jgi:hypothetical protein